jgi:pimeloyl-ACP methyl ester carboxylesterase
MTQHYFDHPEVKLHYYKFGSGEQKMLCFHGFGMHGKQFRALGPVLGEKYTFYSFDLFFHKETKLADQSLQVIKKGISKNAFARIIEDFCAYEQIGSFSVIGYSMGSHYATVIVEQLGSRVNEYIVAAPASINPGMLIRFFCKNKIGQKILEKVVLSKKAITGMINLFKRLHLLDEMSRDILHKEVGTEELRFNFYACFIYLRFFETDEIQLLKTLQDQNIRSIFIFAKRDRMYPRAIGDAFFKKLPQAEVFVLDETHEMIKQNFVVLLAGLLL